MTGISEELRPTCDGAWPIDGQMDCAGEQIVREICPSATELPDHRPDDRAQVAVYASLNSRY